MDSSFRTQWVELFRRGEVDDDIRLLAAQGLLASRPAEQLAILALLAADPDARVAAAARATLEASPRPRIEGLLARPDAPSDLRAFFAALGIEPAAAADTDDDTPLIDAGPEPPPVLDEGDLADLGDDRLTKEPSVSAVQKIASLTIPQRVQLAMKGRREERAILIRDPNKMIALAVLASPKITDSEVESIARMTNVAEDVLRTISTTRGWMKSYSVCVALVKNPKTPVAISMNLMSRLIDKDLRMLSTDRNVPEVLRTTARRKIVVEKR